MFLHHAQNEDVTTRIKNSQVNAHEDDCNYRDNNQNGAENEVLFVPFQKALLQVTSSSFELDCHVLQLVHLRVQLLQLFASFEQDVHALSELVLGLGQVVFDFLELIWLGC